MGTHPVIPSNKVGFNLKCLDPCAFRTVEKCAQFKGGVREDIADTAGGSGRATMLIQMSPVMSQQAWSQGL